MAEDQQTVTLKLDDKNYAVVNLHGATLTSWIQNGQEVIFVSKDAIFNNKKAIRGGVPVVFPQFGAWDLGPQHGFCRISKWEQVGDCKVEDGCVKCVFRLCDNEDTRKMWNNKFELLYSVALTQTDLNFELVVRNKGDRSFSFTWLLHTYFKLDDVAKATVSGLGGLTYIDKTQGGQEFVEKDNLVKITGFTDRVYKTAPGPHDITGVAGGRTIRVEKDNFLDTVVWNPWIENAKKMADFGDDQYTEMVCVEAGCVAAPVEVGPGEQYKSSQKLKIM
jgi:glucose-6-phosphate 1-epimerase